MDKELAHIAIQFLSRVQLTGQEVPAFNAVMTALSEIAKRDQESPEHV